MLPLVTAPLDLGLMDALGEIQSMLSSITALYPESLSYEGGDDD